MASPERIVSCFDRYIRESGTRVSRAVFAENLVKKLSDPVFRADMAPLLRPGIEWDIYRGAEVVQKELIARLPGEVWRSPKT